MIEDNLSVLHPFILSWNLRNVLAYPSILTLDQPSVVGTCLGEYPINGWKPYFLEVPREGHKKDISGRFYSACGIGIKNTKLNPKRTINLPIYSHFQNYDVGRLKIVIKHWSDIGIPDDIPCIALAVKCKGVYSDYREAQYVTVLTIWNDSVARILSLDWFEGPLEDCITPEWYMESTPLMNLREAINKIRNIYDNAHWDNISFSIFTIPTCLGSCLHGEKAQASYKLWDYEWKYTDHGDLKSDLGTLLDQVQRIFLEDQQESDIYG